MSDVFFTENDFGYTERGVYNLPEGYLIISQFDLYSQNLKSSSCLAYGNSTGITIFSADEIEKIEDAKQKFALSLEANEFMMNSKGEISRIAFCSKSFSDLNSELEAQVVHADDIAFSEDVSLLSMASTVVFDIKKATNPVKISGQWYSNLPGKNLYIFSNSGFEIDNPTFVNFSEVHLIPMSMEEFFGVVENKIELIKLQSIDLANIKNDAGIRINKIENIDAKKVHFYSNSITALGNINAESFAFHLNPNLSANINFAEQFSLEGVLEFYGNVADGEILFEKLTYINTLAGKTNLGIHIKNKFKFVESVLSVGKFKLGSGAAVENIGSEEDAKMEIEATEIEAENSEIIGNHAEIKFKVKGKVKIDNLKVVGMKSVDVNFGSAEVDRLTLIANLENKLSLTDLTASSALTGITMISNGGNAVLQSNHETKLSKSNFQGVDVIFENTNDDKTIDVFTNVSSLKLNANKVIDYNTGIFRNYATFMAEYQKSRALDNINKHFLVNAFEIYEDVKTDSGRKNPKLDVDANVKLSYSGGIPKIENSIVANEVEIEVDRPLEVLAPITGKTGIIFYGNSFTFKAGSLLTTNHGMLKFIADDESGKVIFDIHSEFKTQGVVFETKDGKQLEILQLNSAKGYVSGEFQSILRVKNLGLDFVGNIATECGFLGFEDIKNSGYIEAMMCVGYDDRSDESCLKFAKTFFENEFLHQAASNMFWFCQEKITKGFPAILEILNNALVEIDSISLRGSSLDLVKPNFMKTPLVYEEYIKGVKEFQQKNFHNLKKLTIFYYHGAAHPVQIGYYDKFNGSWEGYEIVASYQNCITHYGKHSTSSMCTTIESFAEFIDRYVYHTLRDIFLVPKVMMESCIQNKYRGYCKEIFPLSKSQFRITNPTGAPIKAAVINMNLDQDQMGRLMQISNGNNDDTYQVISGGSDYNKQRTGAIATAKNIANGMVHTNQKAEDLVNRYMDNQINSFLTSLTGNIHQNVDPNREPSDADLSSNPSKGIDEEGKLHPNLYSKNQGESDEFLFTAIQDNPHKVEFLFSHFLKSLGLKNDEKLPFFTDDYTTNDMMLEEFSNKLGSKNIARSWKAFQELYNVTGKEDNEVLYQQFLAIAKYTAQYMKENNLTLEQLQNIDLRSDIKLPLLTYQVMEYVTDQSKFPGDEGYIKKVIVPKLIYPKDMIKDSYVFKYGAAFIMQDTKDPTNVIRAFVNNGGLILDESSIKVDYVVNYNGILLKNSNMEVKSMANISAVKYLISQSGNYRSVSSEQITQAHIDVKGEFSELGVKEFLGVGVTISVAEDAKFAITVRAGGMLVMVPMSMVSAYEVHGYRFYEKHVTVMQKLNVLKGNAAIISEDGAESLILGVNAKDGKNVLLDGVQIVTSYNTNYHESFAVTGGGKAAWKMKNKKTYIHHTKDVELNASPDQVFGSPNDPMSLHYSFKGSVTVEMVEGFFNYLHMIATGKLMVEGAQYFSSHQSYHGEVKKGLLKKVSGYEKGRLITSYGTMPTIIHIYGNGKKALNIESLDELFLAASFNLHNAPNSTLSGANGLYLVAPMHHQVDESFSETFKARAKAFFNFEKAGIDLSIQKEKQHDFEQTSFANKLLFSQDVSSGMKMVSEFGSVHLNGVDLVGGEYDIYAKHDVFDYSTFVIINKKSSHSLSRAAIEFGLKNNLATLVNDAKGVSNAEGGANTSFAIMKTMATAVKVFSGDIVSGYVQISITKMEQKHQLQVKKLIPNNHLDAKVNVNAARYIAEGTNVKGKSWIIKTEQFFYNSVLSHLIEQHGVTRYSGNVELMEGTGALEYQAMKRTIEEGKWEGGTAILEEFNVESNLISLNGVQVQAKKIYIDTKFLIIESLLDFLKEYENSYGVALNLQGFDLDKLDKLLDGVNGSEGKRDKRWVERVSRLIGSENMEIFVSSVLKVKGAIIASAEVDEQGRYTPAGLMTLMATETILEDLVGYDEGHTYGLAVNGIASYGDANKAFGPEFSGTIGKHDYKQYVRATIVGTNLDLGNRSGALNTNLEQVVTIEGNGMKPVKFYIPTASEEQLKGAFKRINEFTLKERVIDPVKRLGEKIGEAFSSATESIVKFFTPESPIEGDQAEDEYEIFSDEGEGEIEEDKKEKQKPEQCAKKTNYFESYDDEDEIEDAEELEELEALREMIAEWDYEDSIKAAKARIAQEKVSGGNWFSNLFISNAEASDGREIERNSLKETIKEVAGEITEETGRFIVDEVTQLIKENPRAAESIAILGENAGFFVGKLFEAQGGIVKGWMRIGLGNELADQVSEKVSESMDELFNYALSKLEGMTDNQKVGVASGIVVAAAVFKSKQVANKAYDKYLSKYFEPSDAFKITETHVFKNKNELKDFMSNHEVENAVNKFMRGATSKCTNYKIDIKENGNRILSFFAPARNEGYGKMYIQEIDKKGNIVKEFKDTIGPNGKLIERKWIFGEGK